MTTLKMELTMILRSGLAAGSLALLLVLATLAVWSGMREVDAQQRALARIEASHRADVAGVARHYAKGGEAGYAAYSTPHLTTNPPAPLAFAAIGQRDIQPSALRVRLLGLQAQLYESEPVNPELALSGRLDFAFVLAYLTPLFVIALMHDLVAGEREAGRLRLLSSLPSAISQLWRRRIGLRFALVFAACALPLAAGALLSGVSALTLLLVLATTGLYIAFWFGLSAWVAGRARTAASGAAVLLACLVVLTMILPTAVNSTISGTIPVARGVELAMAQRQQVHQGWDLPKAETFAKFFQSHPEWKDTPPVTRRFHWKWYYAMHQAGDDAVAPQLADYRHSILQRERWTERAGWLLAVVDVQVLLHRLANTDLQAQLAFHDQVTAYHTRLRRFYYPYIFNERRFGPAEFAQLPAFVPGSTEDTTPGGPLAMLALLALLSLVAGFRQLRTTAH